MPGLRIAATVTALLALAIAPAAAQATVTSSQITAWASSEPGTPANSPYLISFDNDNTTLSVSGTAGRHGLCRHRLLLRGCPRQYEARELRRGPQRNVHDRRRAAETDRGHACRLRAVPASGEAGNDNSDFAGPQVAVSEAAIPVSAIAGGPNANLAYNFYVNDVTFTGWARGALRGPIP